MPASASWSERKVASFLKQRLHLPDYVLVAFFGLRLRTWLLILAWFLAAPLAQHWDLGPLYVGATNGERDSGWWSGLKAGRVGVGVADYLFLLLPHLYKLGEKRGRGKKVLVSSFVSMHPASRIFSDERVGDVASIRIQRFEILYCVAVPTRYSTRILKSSLER